jgi:serum/glucocorticoid-regulated kinase 2
VKNLLSALLERNPQKRLGFNGAEEIKIHPFFKHVNWSALEKRQVKAPVREAI